MRALCSFSLSNPREQQLTNQSLRTDIWGWHHHNHTENRRAQNASFSFFLFIFRNEKGKGATPRHMCIYLTSSAVYLRLLLLLLLCLRASSKTLAHLRNGATPFSYPNCGKERTHLSAGVRTQSLIDHMTIRPQQGKKTLFFHRKERARGKNIKVEN